MTFKDILIPILSAAEDEPALRAAEIVADMGDGHLRAVFMAIEPDPIIALDSYISDDVWRAITQQLSEDAKAARAALERGPWLRRAKMHELRTRPGQMSEDLAALARSADLTIMMRPAGGASDAIRSTLFEAVLMGSGRPVMLVPPQWRGSLGRRVFVAWSGKREGARAIADAAPFLESADRVLIATVGQEDPHNTESMQAIAANLARRGVKPEVKVISQRSGDEGGALIDAAQSFDADLLVMGGYGHARASEFIFGGMTRRLSRSAPFPVLMSH